MDYNNMNKRASRSSYNTPTNRKKSDINNSKRRENNADFNEFKKKRPTSPQNQSRNVSFANPSIRKTPQSKGSHPVNAAAQKQRATPNQQRPQNPKNKNHNSYNKKNIRNSQRKPVQSKPQTNLSNQRKKDWVYPEGYNAQIPPQYRNGQRPPQRRPQNQNGKRPAQKKKAAPAIRIHINWQRVGAICSAIAIRFVCCLIVVILALTGYYFFNFHTEQQLPYEKIKYVFTTVSGEGEDAVTTYNEFVSESSLSYDREELLISFSQVSKWLGTAQVGDIYSMRFVLDYGNESQTVVFHNSSQDVFVNGCPIVMKCRAQFRHGEVWVPLSFVKNYINGVEVAEKKDKITLSKNGEELSFTLSPSYPIDPVPLPEEEE